MRFPVLLLGVLILAACQQGSYADSEEVAAGAARAPAASDFAAEAPTDDAQVVLTAQQATPAQLAEQKLIKTAHLGLAVDDYAAAMDSVRRTVVRFEAYLGGENEQRGTYRIENTFTVRVAPDQFDALLVALADIADQVDYRRVTVQDVTEQYVDTEARLRSQQAAEAQYLAILERSGSIEEVLAVQRRLDEVREEIERSQGRLRYLDNQIGLSTVTVSLYQQTDYSLAASPGFFSQVGDALADGWRGVLAFVIAVAALWPVLLVGGFALWLVLRYRRGTPATT